MISYLINPQFNYQDFHSETKLACKDDRQIWLCYLQNEARTCCIVYRKQLHDQMIYMKVLRHEPPALGAHSGGYKPIRLQDEVNHKKTMQTTLE